MTFFKKFAILITVLVHVREARTCNSDQFQCDNGQCVRMTDVCDRREDCNDGSDEARCMRHRISERDVPAQVPSSLSQNASQLLGEEPGPCSNGKIPCDDGNRCIYSSWRCDGEEDCHDGSDEQRCDKIECLFGKFTCENGRGCIYPEWVCDGVKQCRDGSDEKRCDKEFCRLLGKTACVTWNRHICIPQDRLCDGVQNCDDGSDEKGCNKIKKRPCLNLCLYGNLPCDDDCGCFSPDNLCDGRNDCDDGSDEKHCGEEYCYFHGKIPCGDRHHCVDQEWVCDGEEDCDDGSDERKCGGLPETQ